MTSRRFIVTDMDDTMIVAYGKPTEAVCEMWNELSKDENNCLVVATGQQYQKVKNTFLANNLVLPEYIIADQGSTIYSTREDKELKVYWLNSKEVKLIYDQFFKLGGTMPFVRIYTPELAFVFDCKEAKEFFASTNQKNVLFGQDLTHIIENGTYTKVILMNTQEIVDELVRFAGNMSTLMAVNTGVTNYGKCGFHRLELINSNKKTGLEMLLSISADIPNGEPVDIICLGDERSDYGLAEVALSINLYPNCTGHFAIIDTGRSGNLILKADSERLGKYLGYSDKVILAPGVDKDGWTVAISKWKEVLATNG